ncbi:galactosyltransferase [Desmophyllum pertusum]|uniref:Hexosyltransferase n=1 Tax=Desmophyllum pertusum TaxID=174260 RepID=A0A9W9YUE1_9CNID|nr:galactosyltransferase [Desmophyllum pertusum]
MSRALKPCVLLVLLFLLGLLFAFNSFFANYGNKVAITQITHQSLRPKLTEHDGLYSAADMNKHLSFLRKGFRRSLDKYDASRRNFGKKFNDAVENEPLHILDLSEEILQQKIVCKNELFLLIQVHSSPENFMSRQAIRLTWGSMEHFIGNRQQNNGGKFRSWKTVFLIGQSSNTKINHLVKQEASIYKDIVIGSFEDTYRNLYMKMIFSINWPLDQKCHASYILKTDEDCFVNMGNLLNWLSSYHEANGTRPLYAGRVQIGTNVIRDNKSRYYISKKDHPANKFHAYVSGGGYVISGNLLPLLVEVSRRSPVFPNEDALLGSLMHRLGVQPTNNSKFLPLILCFFLYGEDAEADSFRETHMCGLSRQIILHGVRDKSQLEMHFNSALLNYFPTFCSSQTNYDEMRDQCEDE